MDRLRSLYEYYSRRIISHFHRVADVVVGTAECVFQSIGEWVRQIRYANGLTQEGFAELLDVDPRTVQRWEADEQVPRDRMFYRIQQVRLEGRFAATEMIRLAQLRMEHDLREARRIEPKRTRTRRGNGVKDHD